MLAFSLIYWHSNDLRHAPSVRLLLVFTSTLAWGMLSAGLSSAQHVDALVVSGCVDGACIPNPANFGYYQNAWRKWPTSRPREVHAGTSEVTVPDSLPQVELPDPRFEGEINPPTSFHRNRPATEPPVTPVQPPIPQPDSPSLPPFELPSPESEQGGAYQHRPTQTLVATGPTQLPARVEVRHQPRLAAPGTNAAHAHTQLPGGISSDRTDTSRTATTKFIRATVQTVSWDNPLREGMEKDASSPDDQAFQRENVTNQPRAQWRPIASANEKDADHEATPETSRKVTLNEPARIQLPDNVTPLPPPVQSELSPESDFVIRRNPMRATPMHTSITSTVAPTGFYGNIEGNPLRKTLPSAEDNPLRTGVNLAPAATGEAQFRNPLRVGQ